MLTSALRQCRCPTDTAVATVFGTIKEWSCTNTTCHIRATRQLYGNYRDQVEPRAICLSRLLVLAFRFFTASPPIMECCQSEKIHFRSLAVCLPPEDERWNPLVFYQTFPIPSRTRPAPSHEKFLRTRHPGHMGFDLLASGFDGPGGEAFSPPPTLVPPPKSHTLPQRKEGSASSSFSCQIKSEIRNAVSIVL